MTDNIIISSKLIYVSSSVDNIVIQSAKDVIMSTAGSFTINVGPQGSKNPTNVYRVNSPNIELGYQLDPTVTLEAVPKSERLITVLQKMLNIMSDIVSNPEEKECILGEIKQLSSQLNEIKSTITKTY